MNEYISRFHESSPMHNATKIVLNILDTKYEKADLNKTIYRNCKKLKFYERTKLLKLLKHEMFLELDTGYKTHWFRTKGREKASVLRNYPVTKFHESMLK